MIEFDDPDDPLGQAEMASKIISRGIQNILDEQMKGNTEQKAEQPSEKDFIQETIDFWEKRAGMKFTREDARQMIENVTGYFRILNEWDRRENGKEKAMSLESGK